nr:unnamed protein product [Spirometra erinaceieuropaei]
MADAKAANVEAVEEEEEEEEEEEVEEEGSDGSRGRSTFVDAVGGEGGVAGETAIVAFRMLQLVRRCLTSPFGARNICRYRGHVGGGRSVSGNAFLIARVDLQMPQRGLQCVLVSMDSTSSAAGALRDVSTEELFG